MTYIQLGLYITVLSSLFTAQCNLTFISFPCWSFNTLALSLYDLGFNEYFLQPKVLYHRKSERKLEASFLYYGYSTAQVAKHDMVPLCCVTLAPVIVVCFICTYYCSVFHLSLILYLHSIPVINSSVFRLYLLL